MSETQSRLGAYDTYKPRESKEKVRNCTQLERTLTDEIVNKVVFTLLDLKKNLEPEKTTDNSEQRTSNGSLLLNWKSGGKCSHLMTFIYITISLVASLIQKFAVASGKVKEQNLLS